MHPVGFTPSYWTISGGLYSFLLDHIRWTSILSWDHILDSSSLFHGYLETEKLLRVQLYCVHLEVWQAPTVPCTSSVCCGGGGSSSVDPIISSMVAEETFRWSTLVIEYFTIQVVNCNFLNLYGSDVLQHKGFLTIFSLWTQQIEVRKVAIKSDYFSP